MPQILLTGASGQLGTRLRQWFTARGRSFLATDIVAPADGAAVELVDLANGAEVDRLMIQDISAVVHFGGMASEAGWQTLLEANIMGTYNIFEAARKAGVTRIIFASSYHVQGMYPTGGEPVAPEDPYRPDSLYGVSKAFGETLSRLYFDKFGIECLAIRICAASAPSSPRDARLWFSQDDMSSLVDHALDVPVLGHRTMFGISDNPNAFFRNPPDADFGWSPGHGALELCTPDPREPLDAADPRQRLIGGAFTQWGHPADEASARS